jgi:cytoskeletal protein CcmA (bactofilin family)
MALWKETTQGEQSETPEKEPAQVSPILPRKENPLKSGRESVFGAGVTIEGKLDGDGDVRIAGQFKGDIHIKGELSIEKGARVTAKINADSVTIGGELEGNVIAGSQVRILESGQMVGDLKTSKLTVAAGSRMRGHVEFGWNDSESARIASIRAPDKSKTGSSV